GFLHAAVDRYAGDQHEGAEDDAERGKDGADLLLPQSGERQAEDVTEAHGGLLSLMSDRSRRERPRRETASEPRLAPSDESQLACGFASPSPIRRAGYAVYFGENGCLTVSFLAKISSIFGSFFMAFLMAILVASSLFW